MAAACAIGPPYLSRAESGTGKELVRAWHHYITFGVGALQDADAPFGGGELRCAAEDLIESELVRLQEGRLHWRPSATPKAFSSGQWRTSFLDEIMEMSPIFSEAECACSRKEAFAIRRHTEFPIEVRVIAATNNHRESLESGAIRKDLYYRLSVSRFTSPL